MRYFQRFIRTRSFLLSFVAILVVLTGVTMVMGQANLNGFSYLPVIANDRPSGPGPTPTLPPPGSGDWPMVAANPQRTSWTPEEVTSGTNLLWYRPIEGYIPQNSQIIAAQGLLFVSTSNGLYALHAATGDVVWRFDTEMPLGNSPTVANGVVYVGGYDRKLHALDAATGAHLWSFTAGAGFSTNPLVVEGKVIAGNRDGRMYAIGAQGTAQEGELIWQYQTGAPIYVSAAYNNGHVYFAAGNNYAYALNVNSGALAWRSAQMPGLQYQSYWPVVFRDMVIFSAAHAYREALSPGTRSVSSPEGDIFGNYRDVQLKDLFPDMIEGTLVGENLGPQPWSNGYPVLDVSRITQYLEDNPAQSAHTHKPWRRMMVMLKMGDGSEFRFDSDNDGYMEYAPVTYWGTGSGNRYPGVVGPDNVFYFGGVWRCCSDAKGYVMGWRPENPAMLSVTGGFGALAEPQAISAGGQTMYRNICCDRVGDWFNLMNQGRRGQLWSYDLSEQAPGYDSQTWTVFPGWPRLKGFYTGDLPTTNGAYHNHGDQNPIIPYQGRLYTHRSNVILAFGPGSGPGHLPYVEEGGAQAPGASLTEAQLRSRLESEVQEMVAAGLLRPGYYNVSQFLGRGLEDYFDNPGDTIYTLSRAYPHLSPQLQDATRAYLQQVFNTYFDPHMYSVVGWADGAPREDMMLPPEVQADMLNYPPRPASGAGFVWQYPQHNFYALWKYVEIFPEQASRAYQLAKDKVQVPVPNPPVPDYFLQQPYEVNAWIAGYIGFLELQQVAGMSGTDSALRTQVTNELNRLLQMRVNQFSKDSYWEDNRFHKKHLDIAANFMFLVPELGDYMNQNIRAQVQGAVNEYEYIAPYWFVSRYESAIGEGVMSPLYNYNALFSAKAYVLDQTRAELSKYLDVPAFQRGDLFYIQNLVAAIEAP